MVKLLIILSSFLVTTNGFSQQLANTRDTCFIIDSLHQLPKKVQQVLLNQKPIPFNNDGFLYTIKGCYLYNNQLFLPVRKIVKISKLSSDNCEKNFVSLKGLLCSASGCINGLGNGDCRAMFLNNKAVLINIKFIIYNAN